MSRARKASRVNPDSIFTPQTQLEQSWWDYHSANPHVLEAFRSVCEELIEGGKKREGAKAVAEIVRNHRTYGGKLIKIGNSYVSYYARYLAASDDRFASFFSFKASPKPKPTKLPAGYTELLAYAQAEEAHTHAIVKYSDPLTWEDQHKPYYERMREAFPEIALRFPLSTEAEVDEYNTDLLEQYPGSRTRSAYNLWAYNEEFDCAMHEHMTGLRHAALRAAGLPILTTEEDETNVEG